MPSDKIIDVKAGSNVTAVWRHTLECSFPKSYATKVRTLKTFV